MTSKLIAFHGKKGIKEKYLSRVREHRKADQLIKGSYWADGKGCAVGCTVHSSDHLAYETELGIPSSIALLEDGLFERLPNGTAMAWPERFLSSINIGADLSAIWPRFMMWMLTDEKEGVIRGVKNEKVKKAIVKASDLYRKLAEGKTISLSDRGDDAIAARAAIAAIDARDVAIASVAIAAIDARAAMDVIAAIDARVAIAAIAARAAIDEFKRLKDESYTRMADKLIEFLEAAKPCSEKILSLK